jgi:hypothetical protein
MSALNIDELVELDRFALDVEAERSAANLQTVGQLCAEAKTAKDVADLELKRVRASAELDIRKSPPSRYGLEKFTEGSIAALVEVDKGVVEKGNDLLRTKETHSRLEAAVSALSDKSSRIKDLTALWIGGYYAEPATKKTDKYQ